MSIPQTRLNEVSTVAVLHKRQIRIVKGPVTSVNSNRHDLLLKNLDYMETQIGRLAKMARDVRAEILLLTTE